MPIFANIIKPGTRKEKEQVKQEPVLTLKNIHEAHLKSKAGAILDKPMRQVNYQDTNEINIKKTSRYLEDLTNKGD